MSIEEINIIKSINKLEDKPTSGNLNIERSAEKMKQAEKIILTTLGIETNDKLDNFDEKLNNAIKSLPKYLQIENKLKDSELQNLPHDLFQVLKKESDHIKIYDPNIPKDGTLITSMKQGPLECTGRTIIASTFLQEHNIKHVIASAPGHVFVIIEQSSDTLIYFDANNNLYFSFPKSALEGYAEINKSSECHLREYTPRDTDFVDGVSTVFSHFVAIPAKEGVGRRYLGNVAAGLNGAKEFEVSNITIDKEMEESVKEIEKQIYGTNDVLESFDLRIEELDKILEIQRIEEKTIVSEILSTHPTYDDFVESFIKIILDKNMGDRIPYIKNASLEKKKYYSGKVWEALHN